MGLEQVVDEILAQGKREADALQADARKEAEAVIADAEATAQREAERRAHEAETQAEALERRVLAAASLEAKKQRLAAQADVLASIRTRAEDRIVKLSDGERAELLQQLVKRASLDALGASPKAYGRSEDREAIEKLGFTFAGEIQCLGGAVLESQDGRLSEDLRFETMLEDVWRSSVHDVVNQVME